MKADQIIDGSDMRRYVEGVLNDLEAGIITREDAMKYFLAYTLRVHYLGELLGESKTLKEIREIISDESK